MTEVGAWTVEKHKRLEKYVHISRYVRRRFAESETTYIELFCGPGRSIIEGTPEIINGSAITAAQTAKNGGFPYTDIHLADANESFVEAARKRMPEDVGRVHPYAGDAEKTVDDVVRHLNKHGLHFAFLDPYALDPLSVSIIQKFAAFQRMDMLIHVSIQDFQRNLRRYMKEAAETLERFAPGWRSVVNANDNDRNIRIAIFNHWLGLIQKLDMEASRGIEKVVGSNQQPLYWLVFVARHERAHEFWDEIKNIGDAGIHWVIVGGESGPHARPMKAEWVESIFAQCREANISFFFKQWGGVRKDMTGRKLHGRTYDEMPAVANELRI